MITVSSLFLSEFVGTTVLLLLGNGVCAVNTLRKSSGKNSGWLLISLGWGLAVFLGASIADPSGGHLNPAVTLMQAFSGKLEWTLVPYYVAGQLLGSILGAILAWAAFKQLFDSNNVDEDGNVTGENKNTGGIFFTIPAGNKNFWNVVTEFIATSVLLGFIAFGPTGGELGPLTYFAVGFVIVGILLSLGTPTGCAINPFRDFGPRLAYAFILPITGKGSAQWGYAWVPILGPVLAAIAVGTLAAVI